MPMLCVLSIVMCVLSLKTYFPCVLFEKKKMHVLCVYFFPTREMMRMVMIWIVIRYYCVNPVAWGTAAANCQHSQSRGQGGGKDRRASICSSHSLLICFQCNQRYNTISIDFPVSSKFISRYCVFAMLSQIASS